ncbi:MAG: hypothetical protein K2P49_06150 [Oscillospiraceae bacterium]|nr:hypothetical protein [Oscillospiraceae bacterium]
MNRNYRSYCSRMGEAMVLRHIFPRSSLSDNEMLRLYQTAQTTDPDILRQTVAEMFPERFPDGLPQEEQALPQAQDQQYETCGSTMVCPY